MDNRMDEKNAELLRSRSRAAFDAQAPTYDTGMEGDHARRLYPHVLAEVARAVAGNPAPRLLDLGCGTGAVTDVLAPFVRRVVAVDHSREMLDVARRRLDGRDNVDLREGDLEALPVADGELDAALLVLASVMRSW